MPGDELSDTEISLLRERISLAARYTDLTHHESEALELCNGPTAPVWGHFVSERGRASSALQNLREGRVFPTASAAVNSVRHRGRSLLNDCNGNASRDRAGLINLGRAPSRSPCIATNPGARRPAGATG